jgi:hypothetical protein
MGTFCYSVPNPLAFALGNSCSSEIIIWLALIHVSSLFLFASQRQTPLDTQPFARRSTAHSWEFVMPLRISD